MEFRIYMSVAEEKLRFSFGLLFLLNERLNISLSVWFIATIEYMYVLSHYSQYKCVKTFPWDVPFNYSQFKQSTKQNHLHYLQKSK